MNEPTVPLRDYFERIFAMHEQRHDQEEHARSTALNAIDERLRNMNEFRAQAADRDASFLTKAEFSAYRDAAEQRMRWLAGTLIGVAGLAVSVIAVIMANQP